MINYWPDLQQGIVPGKNIDFQNFTWIKYDSVSIWNSFQLNETSPHVTIPLIDSADIVIPDSLCRRNSITDITFYDSVNVVTKIEQEPINGFPFCFIDKNLQMQTALKASVVKHLKPGLGIPVPQFHADWVIGIILIVAFLFSLVRLQSKNILSGFGNFFLFKGITDSPKRNKSGLFLWQSLILNLISSFTIALFFYSSAIYFHVVPTGTKGIIFWLISFAIILLALSLRHLICIITGYASGEKEAFKEYQQVISQSYRFSALFLSVMVIMLYYTILPASDICFIAGFIIIGVMYLIRIISLLIIFLNKNISILYLILYLCALEILPVLILVKYFTGLD